MMQTLKETGMISCKKKLSMKSLSSLYLVRERVHVEMFCISSQLHVSLISYLSISYNSWGKKQGSKLVGPEYINILKLHGPPWVYQIVSNLSYWSSTGFWIKDCDMGFYALSLNGVLLGDGPTNWFSFIHLELLFQVFEFRHPLQLSNADW